MISFTSWPLCRLPLDQRLGGPHSLSQSAVPGIWILVRCKKSPTHVTVPTELCRRRNRAIFQLELFYTKFQMNCGSHFWLLRSHVFSAIESNLCSPQVLIKYSAVRSVPWLSLCGHVMWACLRLWSIRFVQSWSCFQIPRELNLLRLIWTKICSENFLLHWA
jgi:hypothetical protein